MTRRKKSVLPRVLGLLLISLLAGGYFWQRNGVASVEAEPETVRVRRETLDRTVSATAVPQLQDVTDCTHQGDNFSLVFLA